MVSLDKQPTLGHIKKIAPYLGWFLILFILITGMIVQSNSYLSHDVSWLMHATDRFLAGGNYSTNFYEINPPMVLYIHILPVLLAHFAKLSMISSVRIYIFTIAIVSFLICAHLLKKIIKPSDRALYFITLIVLALNFIISPASDFGQREHIAIMLIMPYLLNAVIRLQGGRLSYLVVTGLMAGVGFCIKPHLAVTFLLVEAYLLLKTKNYYAFVNKEIIAIFLVVASYFLAVFYFNSDYFTLVPRIYNFFIVFFQSSSSIAAIYFNPRVFFIIEASILYFAFYRDSKYKNFITVLMIGTIGFFIYYIAEPIAIEYHTIPMFSLALLLTVFLFSEYLLSTPFKIKMVDGFFVLAMTLIIFWLPTHLLWAASRFMTIKRNDHTSSQLIQYVKQHNDHKPFYFFSTNCRLTYPLVDYAGVDSASRYECLWPVIYITKLFQLHTPDSIAELDKERVFFTHTVVEDMKRNMPELVFISPTINWTVYRGVSFDYIKFFSQSTEFRDIWKNYKYISKIGDISIYKNINN